jgi:hypothetical protein
MLMDVSREEICFPFIYTYRALSFYGQDCCLH